MNAILTGKAHVLGNNIDTDQIVPGRYLELVDPKEIAAHCLEGADPALAARFATGDIVVAGTNFGCGSSREHAAIALIHKRAACVLAESFARIFYRNAINLGLPLVVVPGISQSARGGDDLTVNLETGVLKNNTQNTSMQGDSISDYAMGILRAGGIKPMFLARYGERA